MTIMEFIGCTLIGFGPALSMFAITIARDPIRIIILITAAFFWLLSLLLSSIVWFAVVPLRKQLAFGVVCSVAFQEAGRFLFYRVLRKSKGPRTEPWGTPESIDTLSEETRLNDTHCQRFERKAELGLKKVTEVGADGAVVSSSRTTLSYVSGLGFGVMSGVFSLLNVLADAIGPGTVGLNGGSSCFFLTSALTTSAFVLLHTFWGVVSFHALDHSRWPLVAFVGIAHLVTSCLTLLNPAGYYVASLVPIYLLLLVSGVLAFHAAGGRIHALMRFKGQSLPQQQQQHEQQQASPH
uniref:Putative conserved plasma membrane protein n=1 Tax=Hyalomma excavatum TaxID=257692 RepID=A0A131XFJ8_9ACAR